MGRSVQVSTRVDEETAERLDLLAQATGRTKAHLFNEAIREYVDGEMQFIEAVKRGDAEARAGLGRAWEDVKTDLQSIIEDAAKQ